MRFIHSRPKGEKGGLTVGYVLDLVTNKRAVVTIAKCSHRDNYNKSMGRLICERRYAYGTGFLVPVDPEDVDGSILRAVAKVLA